MSRDKFRTYSGSESENSEPPNVGPPPPPPPQGMAIPGGPRFDAPPLNHPAYGTSPSQGDDLMFYPQIVLPGSLPEEYSSLVPIHQYYNMLASSGFPPQRFPAPAALAAAKRGGRNRGSTVSGSYGQYFSYFPAPGPKERRRSSGVRPKAGQDGGECDIGYCLIKTPGKKPQRTRAASASVAK